MRAVILAGGKGSRLRPYTTVLPKPLMPIGDHPILELIIRQLKKHGVRHITIAVGHMAELISAFFGNGQKWGVKIDYSIEDKPLGTVGPLKLIDDLPENFLVMNGDILTNLDFNKFFSAHNKGGSRLTIAVFDRLVNIDFGVISADKKGFIRDFKEKPNYELSVSMGIYMFNKKALDSIPDDKSFSINHLVLKLLKERKTVNTYKHSGLWLDIGRAEDYAAANSEYENSKKRAD